MRLKDLSTHAASARQSEQQNLSISKCDAARSDI
jgi:hypothetical protein